jgi:4-hydroxybutyryl-CoA dehydratase/vinylacetyl-CoA-Delta-isomerase
MEPEHAMPLDVEKPVAAQTSVGKPGSPGHPITSGADYIESLRGRNLRVYLFGEKVAEPVDHPMIRPSINAVAKTYDLANENPALASVRSSLSGRTVNRFLHVTESVDDVVMQNRMQRKLGQLTGTCFQRCVGMDAINSLHSVTFEIDQRHGTPYHGRFKAFVREMQERNLVIGGAMTDPKGDRGKGPSAQADPDMFVHVVERRADGVVIRGAKAHQTGCVNSHWIVVMPTMRLQSEDKDYAIVCAVPVDDPGLSYIYGRQSCDTRSMEGGEIDQGNAQFGGQEALIVIDDVFVPNERIFMDGETEFAADLVERFTAYHRRSYVCKTGLGDVMIGAAATIADYNGVAKASHIRDKLVEMTHLNETIYGAGIASSHESFKTQSGNYQNNDMLANVCKHNVTRFPYELARLAQDLAGGLVATCPSEKELNSPETGAILRKFLQGRQGVTAENRVRILRLIENMTLGRNAVGYLTESMHGAGSPQAQRIQITRQMDLDYKMKLAKDLAGIEETPAEKPKAGDPPLSPHFDRMFPKVAGDKS